MNRAAPATFALLALLATACRQEPAIERVPADAYTTTATPMPTPSATPTGKVYRTAPASATCALGWAEPPPGPLRSKPLDLLRQSQKMSGTFVVEDMRYWGFRGVERWYVKVHHSTDKAFRLRFLVERREVGEGIVAVAPYATTGFKSPDWKGFDGEGGSVAIRGVPGRWPGQPTDFVKEGGMPAEVRGCFD